VDSGARPRTRFTIVARLLIMIVGAVAAGALVAGAALWGAARQAEAARDMARISGGMSIAAAVAERSTTTATMSRSVHEVAAAAADISSTVSVITGATGATADGASTTRRSAERLNTVTGEIRTLIGQFTH
jgi:methyl-accepting chemotaxis protein